jgi:acyl-CoA hydrolase
VSTGPDFHRGALASPGGTAIVCLASRTPSGRAAVTPELGRHEPVAISRADVRWVVTEFGTAYLFGKSLAERATALVEIAHPEDRDEMAFAAVVGPAEHERVVATASYYLDPANGLADVAYLVDPAW